MSFKVGATLMLFVTIAASVLSNSDLKPSKVTTECCIDMSRTPIPYNITHYKLQHALPPCIEAIVFYTEEEGPICSDPNAPWVPKKINELK
ncbi:C-C motif chemokine 20-like [Heptranchias perlo]|uniref:C-C motif chemokine 20-like n=1 Tax=Heptranchias perlo TaxID=212740 RepID=UPI003559F417